MASHSIVFVVWIKIGPTLRSTIQHLWSLKSASGSLWSLRSAYVIVEIYAFWCNRKQCVLTHARMCVAWTPSAHTRSHMLLCHTPWVQFPITRCSCVRSNTPTNATHNHCPQMVVTTATCIPTSVSHATHPWPANTWNAQRTCACATHVIKHCL